MKIGRLMQFYNTHFLAYTSLLKKVVLATFFKNDNNAYCMNIKKLYPIGLLHAMAGAVSPPFNRICHQVLKKRVKYQEEVFSFLFHKNNMGYRALPLPVDISNFRKE